MFTMPAIHHSARVEDDSLGTLHLNALNGSSGFLGQTESGNSGQNGVFGGLFGVSLSDNHPYRPQDSGMTFHETQSTVKKSCPPASWCASSSSSHRKSSSRDSGHNPKYVDAATSPNGPRRRSLDLDLMTVHKRRNYNRKLSLDELVIGPFSRFNRFHDDAINEHEQTSEPDLTGLSLTEVSISTPSSHVSRHAEDSESKLAEAKKKKKRAHTLDTSVPVRTLRKLEKIKDNKKDHNSNFKHSQNKSDAALPDSGKHDATATSTTEHQRQNTLRHMPSDTTAQPRPDRGCNSHSKDRKLTTKVSSSGLNSAA